MRKRVTAVVYALVLPLVFSTAAFSAEIGPPSEPLWRFETHG